MIEQPAPRPQLVRLPADIRCAADYARLAQEAIAPGPFAYLDGGSGQDRTAAANLAAFAGLAVVPRLLRPVAEGHSRCSLGGAERAHPILLAPVGWQNLFHPHAERATAAAAAATESCMVASTMSSLTLEEIAAAADGERWFQLYFQPDRAVTLDLVRRAEAAGYAAIMVTLDTPIQLPSHRSLAAGFQVPAEAANLRGYPKRPPAAVGPGRSAILNGLMRDAPVWEDLDWLLGEVRVPLWVKGVLHPEDARELAARGVAGLVVSNHGGRTLDGVPSSLSRLAGIRQAAGDGVPLLLDGGVRSGTDVFKAVALGADAVMVGRLQAYALAVAGALGVAHMIRMLREELEACMALAGCATLADVRAAELAPFPGAEEPLP